MWEILKKLWTDPTYFAASVRAVVAFAGGLIASGIIPTDQWKYGFLVMALAQAIPAGNTTPSLSDRIAKATPEDIAQLKTALGQK